MNLLGMFANDAKQHELSWLDYTYPADLSADGKTLLFDEEGGGGALDYSKSGGLTYAVYIRKTDGSPAVLLGEGGAVALSPDGKWVIAQTQESPSQFRLLPPARAKPETSPKTTSITAGPTGSPTASAFYFPPTNPARACASTSTIWPPARASRFPRKA